MTKKYHVLMSEIHSVWYLVEAKNEKEAINKVSCGDYIEAEENQRIVMKKFEDFLGELQ